jgi:hypothetical protein
MSGSYYGGDHYYGNFKAVSNFLGFDLNKVDFMILCMHN